MIVMYVKVDACADHGFVAEYAERQSGTRTNLPTSQAQQSQCVMEPDSSAEKR
jgi:hypothetical protein